MISVRMRRLQSQHDGVDKRGSREDHSGQLNNSFFFLLCFVLDLFSLADLSSASNWD